MSQCMHCGFVDGTADGLFVACSKCREAIQTTMTSNVSPKSGRFHQVVNGHVGYYGKPIRLCRPKSAPARFWSKVSKGDGCWEFAGCSVPGGHRRFRKGNGALVLAHRYSWQLTNGPIPPGMNVCHHCDNPPCVRPDHLFLGTHQDNADDRGRKGRTSSGAVHAAAMMISKRRAS